MCPVESEPVEFWRRFLDGLPSSIDEISVSHFRRKVVRGFFSLSVLFGVCAMLFPLPVALLPSSSRKKTRQSLFPARIDLAVVGRPSSAGRNAAASTTLRKSHGRKRIKVKVPAFVLAAVKGRWPHPMLTVSSRSGAGKKSARPCAQRRCDTRTEAILWQNHHGDKA